MIRVLPIFVALALIVMGSRSAIADGEMSAPKLSGHVESTYNHNILKKGGGVKTNELRSYDAKANTFQLNAAHLVVSGSGTEALSYTVELDAGNDAAVNRSGDPSVAPISVFDVEEGYLTYALTDHVKWTMGKFVTFMGIEVIEGPVNPTVSRGYLFGLAEPYTHVGTFFTVAPMDLLEVKLGVVNDWDTMLVKTSKQTIISRIGLNLGDIGGLGIVPYFGGTVSDLSVDVTGVLNVIADMPLNYQFNYGKLDDSKWMGFGLQPVYNLSDTMSLGVRFEFWGPDAAKAGTTDDLTAMNFTVTPAWKPVSGFMVRPEVRMDISDQESFADNDGNVEKNNLTASLGLSYTF